MTASLLLACSSPGLQCPHSTGGKLLELCSSEGLQRDLLEETLCGNYVGRVSLLVVMLVSAANSKLV